MGKTDESCGKMDYGQIVDMDEKKTQKEEEYREDS